MVDIDSVEEDMVIEIDVANTWNGDEQKHPPIDDDWEKDHQRRPSPHRQGIAC